LRKSSTNSRSWNCLTRTSSYSRIQTTASLQLWQKTHRSAGRKHRSSSEMRPRPHWYPLLLSSRLQPTVAYSIPTLLHHIVDFIAESTRPLPNLQILKILREIHVPTFYLLPSTFNQRSPSVKAPSTESTAPSPAPPQPG
jgi:hypothetical protein